MRAKGGVPSAAKDEKDPGTCDTNRDARGAPALENWVLEKTKKPPTQNNQPDPTRRQTLVGAISAVALFTYASPQPAYARQTAVVRSDPTGLGGKANANQNVVVTLGLPNEYHLTSGANSNFSVTLDDAATARGIVVDTQSGPLQDGEDVRVRFSFATATQALASVPEKKEEQGEAKIECVVYFCRENDVCLLQRVRFEIPFGAQTLTNDDDGELLTQGVTNLRFDVPANDPVPPVNAAAIPTFD
tara:strand:+ start:967 stop:1701 length:735 start_codon:yes stop_codon:yes gene_type:complete